MFGNYHVTNAVPPPATIGQSMLGWWHWLVQAYYGLDFADPTNWRIAVVLLPLVIILWCLAFKGYWRVRSQYGKLDLVNANPFSAKVGIIGEVCRYLITRFVVPVAIVTALLSPFLPGAPHRVPAGKRDYVVCFQDSRGMGAPIDLGTDNAQANKSEPGAKTTAGASQFFNERGSRLDFVRDFTRHLIKGPLANTRVSLIAFQGIANVLVPLTDSADWLNDTLDPTNRFGLHVMLSAPIGDGKVEGKVTTMAACLETARKTLTEQGAEGHEKFIIYYGNGDDASDEKWLAEEEEEIRKAHIEGIVFGVGGPPVQIPLYQGDDQQFSGYYKFRDGSEALSGYNEENLNKLAGAVGWQYLHLDPANMPDKDFLVQQLTESKIEVGRWLLFDYPAGLALAVIMLLAIGDPAASLWNGLGRLFRRMRRRS